MRGRGVRSGSTAHEFASIILPLTMLIFGGVEFGRLMGTRTGLQQTAVDVAPCIWVHPSSSATGGATDTAKTIAYAGC